MLLVTVGDESAVSMLLVTAGDESAVSMLLVTAGDESAVSMLLVTAGDESAASMLLVTAPNSAAKGASCRKAAAWTTHSPVEDNGLPVFTIYIGKFGIDNACVMPF